MRLFQCWLFLCGLVAACCGPSFLCFILSGVLLLRLVALVWHCEHLVVEEGAGYFHYENTHIQIYWKFYLQKTENFQIKISDIFHISAQNIDCGYSLEPPRRGGSNEYPQSMFLSRNKKNNEYPYKPQFYYIKVGFKGVKII